MPPNPKVKGNKRKRAPPTTQLSKNNKQAPQAQVFTEEESLTGEVSFPGKGSLKQQMIHMMGFISPLSEWAKAAETQKSSNKESPAVSPSTRTTVRTRVRHKSTSKIDHNERQLLGGRWPRE